MLYLLSFQFQAMFYSEGFSRVYSNTKHLEGVYKVINRLLLYITFNCWLLVWCFVDFLDLMQGIPVTEDLYSIFTKEKEHEALHKENLRSHQELISQLLQSYMKLLLPDDEKFHGGWALIDCDPRFAE